MNHPTIDPRLPCHLSRNRAESKTHLESQLDWSCVYADFVEQRRMYFAVVTPSVSGNCCMRVKQPEFVGNPVTERRNTWPYIPGLRIAAHNILIIRPNS